MQDENVTLHVVDDGVGLLAEPGGNGLINMEDRASGLGGTCRIRRCEPHGTELTWHVPVSA